MAHKEKVDDGGPAFPVPSVGTGDPRDGMTQGSNGMTLRQYYAGEALKGYLSNPDVLNHPSYSRESLSDECCRMADALIAALKKEPPQ